jgi:hypothetical protein
MAFQVLEYDADQIRISIAGVAVAQGAGVSGFADGEFLSIGFKPQFTMVKGTDGSATRSKTNDRECEIKIILMQSNSLNAALSALLFADVSTPNGTGIGSFIVEDLQGTTLISVPTAWISAPAEVSYDRGAKARSWPISGLWDVLVLGGNG